MQSCIIEIVTETDGGINRFSFQGGLARENGAYTVIYGDGEDEVTLTASEQVFVMERRGACGLFASFVRGERTEMRMQYGEGTASMPMRTFFYSLRSQEDGLSVVLSYVLNDSIGLKNFNLEISIKIISEEK